MGHKGWAAMLTLQSAGVTPEVNLGNPLHTGEKAQKWRIHSGFETQGDVTRNPKQGHQWPHKKGLMSSKNINNVPWISDVLQPKRCYTDFAISKLNTHLVFLIVLSFPMPFCLIVPKEKARKKHRWSSIIYPNCITITKYFTFKLDT